MSDLRLDFCSHEAAKHAVMRWHYSRQMPKSKLVRIGVWEAKRFCGAIIFGLGANRHLASPFGLENTEAAELVRVALAPGREHPTSKCIAISLRLLHRHSPGLKLIVSYADSGQGHAGIIYRAGNWLFLGNSEQSYIKVKGVIEHPRTLYDRYGRQGQSIPWLRQHVDPRAERIPMAPKLKYVYALDDAMRRKLEGVALPYPKHAAEVTPGHVRHQPEEGGATPTQPLHPSAHV